MSYLTASNVPQDPSVLTGEISPETLAESPLNIYGMLPSRSANLAGLILFTFLWAYHTGMFYYRQWWFSITFFIGCGLEVAGYIGRWESSYNPLILDDFLVQIICLTLAPAFIMGGIYYLLAKLVTIYGHKFSILKPMHYSLLFILCDLLSIVLQAIGGGMAATAVKGSEDTDTGTHIMVAGIAFQVFSMSFFIILFGIFLWRVYKVKRVGNESAEFNPEYEQIRRKKLFKLFPYGIAWCVLMIYIRCIYRVVELAEGWTGYLIQTERYFLVLDGLMVFFGVLGISFIHPGFALGKQVIPVEGLHLKKYFNNRYSSSENDETKSPEESV